MLGTHINRTRVMTVFSKQQIFSTPAFELDMLNRYLKERLSTICCIYNKWEKIID